MPKVRIKKIPTDLDKGTNMFNKHTISSPHDGNWNETGISVNDTLSAVPREYSNLEAERGERVITDLNKDGIPENYNVGGKKHYNGGTPLSLPDQSFIFSNDKKKMGIKDPEILKEFGINNKSKKTFTPADIAKKYDLNNYKKILLDPNSTKLQISTAERMISNYNIKLAKLGLVQESLKGFPEGIPSVAAPYIASLNMDPSNLSSTSTKEMKYGGTHKIRKYQMGGTVDATWSASYYSRLQDAYEDHLESFDLTEEDLTFQDYANNLDLYDSEVRDNATEYANKQVQKIQDFSKELPIPGGAVYRPSAQTPPSKVPNISSKTTKSWNIPSDAVQVNDSESDWQIKAKEAINQGKQVYVKSGEGYKRVTGLKTPEGQYDINDPKYKAMGQYAGEYAAMVQMVNSNPELQDSLYEKYKAEQKNSSKKTGPLLSKEQMLNNFFEFQSQVYSIRNLPTADQIDPRWDNADNKMYHEVSKKLGLSPLDPQMIANAQATYAGLVNLSKDPKFNNVFSNYDVVPVGLGDEEFMGREDISPIDSDFGNTTQGQWFRPKNTELSLEDVQQQETITQTKPFKPGSPQYEQPKTETDWWLQDIVKTAGAFGDSNRIKKYLPWDRPLDAVIPEVTFYDPSRALAANSEQANIADQTLSSFAGAQGTSARVSQVQGQALANAANILGDYENKNVAVANQYDSSVANIRNQIGAANREIQKGLYDGTTIANQQFDNSKAMARQGLRQSYIDAITNRAQTQALNSLYPQYNIDPMSGGFVNFTTGRKINPGAAPNDSRAYSVDMNYLNTVKKLKGQGYDESTIRQAMSTGNPQVSQMDDYEREAFLQQYGIGVRPY